MSKLERFIVAGGFEEVEEGIRQMENHVMMNTPTNL
jgi:hypothetical protein